MIYIIDIDGTICKTDGSDYPNSKPYSKRIEKINELYDNGHTIIYMTARGSASGKDWKELTKKQLDSWGCKYHKLNVGIKPTYDAWIDDKAINSEQFFNQYE